MLSTLIEIAQAGLALYQKATGAIPGIKAEMSATDIAAAQAQLDALHAQYEADYASAVASLQAAAAKN